MKVKHIIFFLIILFFIYQKVNLIADDKKKEPTQQITKTKKINKIEVTLCDGRIIYGNIEIQVPEKITIIHELDGIEYVKEISIDEIYEITITNWFPEFIEVKKNGKLYRLYASKYKLELKDSIILKVIQPIPKFFEQFTLSNKFGKSNLYTYWIDLLKPDNSWFTGIAGSENSERNVCFKDVVKKITFKENSGK